MITRNTSSFSMKKRNVKQPFSTEPLHLTNRHCYKFSTLVHRNVIAVEPSKDKNGFIMVQKRKNKTFKPRQSLKGQEWFHHGPEEKEQDFQASPIPPEDSLEIWTSPHSSQARAQLRLGRPCSPQPCPPLPQWCWRYPEPSAVICLLPRLPNKCQLKVIFSLDG